MVREARFFVTHNPMTLTDNKAKERKGNEVKWTKNTSAVGGARTHNVYLLQHTAYGRDASSSNISNFAFPQKVMYFR